MLSLSCTISKIQKDSTVFSGLQAATFFQKCQGSDQYSGATYVRTFLKNHAQHTARYGVPRLALDHDQLTHSASQSLTVSAAVWPPLPACRVSLSVCLCMRGVSFQWQSTALQYVAAVYCTNRHSVGKLPPEVPC